MNPPHCTTVVQMNDDQVVQTRPKPKPGVRKIRGSVRQSVTMPAQLAREVRRVAKERNMTMSRALVTLAQRGVEAEAASRAKLTTAYEQFMAEGDPARKSEAGEDLIRAIFGRAAIAEDPLHSSAAPVMGTHSGPRRRAGDHSGGPATAAELGPDRTKGA